VKITRTLPSTTRIDCTLLTTKLIVMEPGQIGLTSQKRNIARKVEEGVPEELVLQKLRGGTTELNPFDSM